ncbi:MAG: hypothetical protein NVSMB18_19240 [Acetobacteraceae bacterium]
MTGDCHTRLAPVDPFTVVAAARQERAHLVVQLLRRWAKALKALLARNTRPGPAIQPAEPDCQLAEPKCQLAEPN